MGTGKSTVGKALADRLSRRFIDTDTLIEQEARMTIPAIFTDRGEPDFRALERAAIARVCEQQGIVVATGGGAMVNEENAKRLKDSGVVICLSSTPEVIVSRVQEKGDRPLLQGDNPLEKIRTLLAVRAEAYARADFTLDTSQLSIEEVVETICIRLRTFVRN